MPYPKDIEKISPMMKQYIKIKEQHKDELVLYRLGDFYELFFDDALTASRELELTLTGRECGLSERAPMCGVPHHSSEGYIAKLIKKGYRVAICEQMELPSQTKGIVKRGVVRVVTPGTVTENSMLSEERNNYLACIFMTKDGFGFCAADITSGKVFVTESGVSEDGIINELSRFDPKEIICNEVVANNKTVNRFITKSKNITPNILYDGNFDPSIAMSNVTKLFEKQKVSKVAMFDKGFALCALGALVKYIVDTQFEGAIRLNDIVCYREKQYLSLSAKTRKNLELTETFSGRERKGSLIWVLDKTGSAMGKRQLRSFMEKPLVEVDEINKRLDSVEELVQNNIGLLKTNEILKTIHDIERIMTRIVYKSVSPRDLISLSTSAGKLVELKALTKDFNSKMLSELSFEIDTLDDIKEEIEATIEQQPPALLKDGGYIKFGHNPEIDELREILHNSKTYLARMEQKLKDQTGIKTLKVGYNKVFGYYIEVSRLNSNSVPDYFVRKQTLANGERFITEELKQLEDKILGANDKLLNLERAIFENLRERLEKNLERVQKSVDCISVIDVLCSFALVSLENNFQRPCVDNSDVIDIQNGRHPVVEKVIDGELFVPNNSFLDRDKNLVNIITGPNMAGKSTYMRATALIVYMAQIGCFVPASFAHIGVVDAIFTRIGASDDLFSGDSTFMVEMKEVAEILNCATKNSLIILDEIGRGTSTYDGMSMARAVIEHICKCGGLGAKTMFATHYHELTEIDKEFENVKNYNIAAKKRDDDIVFLHKIVEGSADDSYGIEVAKLAGVPKEVTDMAYDFLEKLEQKQVGYNPKQSLLTKTSNSDDIISEEKTKIFEEIDKICIDTLTPIEALNILSKLKKIKEQKFS